MTKNTTQAEKLARLIRDELGPLNDEDESVANLIRKLVDRLASTSPAPDAVPVGYVSPEVLEGIRLNADLGHAWYGELWTVRDAENCIPVYAASPAPDGAAGCDYVSGRLDREAPPRVWLQIDTGGNNDERDEPWPGPEHVTWQDESIGGLEIQYVRADLAAPQPVVENGHG